MPPRTRSVEYVATNGKGVAPRRIDERWRPRARAVGVDERVLPDREPLPIVECPRVEVDKAEKTSEAHHRSFAVGRGICRRPLGRARRLRARFQELHNVSGEVRIRARVRPQPCCGVCRGRL